MLEEQVEKRILNKASTLKKALNALTSISIMSLKLEFLILLGQVLYAANKLIQSKLEEVKVEIRKRLSTRKIVESVTINGPHNASMEARAPVIRYILTNNITIDDLQSELGSRASLFFEVVVKPRRDIEVSIKHGATKKEQKYLSMILIQKEDPIRISFDAVIPPGE